MGFLDPRPEAEAPDATVLRRLQDLLNATPLESDRDLVRLVEERLSTDSVAALKRLGLTETELATLVLPRRTLSHRVARGEALTPEESDRAVRVARTVALAEVVFADRDKALRWLRKAKRQLDGRTPLDYIATEAGARIVEEMLHRVDDGMGA